jgi:hypothetical protein
VLVNKIGPIGDEGAERSDLSRRLRPHLRRWKAKM